MWTDYVLLNSNKKKKRGQRAVGGDKSGRGLRQFSMKGLWTLSFFIVANAKVIFFVCCLIYGWCLTYSALINQFMHCFVLSIVCEKVQSKGRTTYNEVGQFSRLFPSFTIVFYT